MHTHVTFFTPPHARISRRISINIDSFQITYPNCQHHIYSLEDAENFIERHFDTEALDAFRALTPYTYKSDLLRHCALYQLGGYYSDLSLFHFAAIKIKPGQSLYVFRDAVNSSPYVMSTSFIYAEPKHPVSLRAIETIIENVKTRNYGASHHHPTGPEMFGKIVADTFDPAKIAVGDHVFLGDTQHSASLYRAHDRMPVALRYKRGAGISSLGGPRNSYVEQYNKRRAYGEPAINKNRMQKVARTLWQRLKS